MNFLHTMAHLVFDTVALEEGDELVSLGAATKRNLLRPMPRHEMFSSFSVGGLCLSRRRQCLRTEGYVPFWKNDSISTKLLDRNLYENNLQTKQCKQPK